MSDLGASGSSVAHETQHVLQSDQIDCEIQSVYITYARCLMRDDIELKLQISFSCFFIICLVLLSLVCRNLIIIQRIYKRTPSSNMIKINILICACTVFQTLFYLDGPLQLIFGVSIPLFLYLLFEHAAIVILNTALCIGGYAWITTVFSVTLYNKYRPQLKYAYLILLSMNFIILFNFVVSYLYMRVQDYDKMDDVSIGITYLDYILSALSTGLNGIFFAIGCLMLRGYLQNNWQQSHRQEGRLLSRLAYIGLFIVAVRVLQNITNIWHLPNNLKMYSITNRNWWWLVYSSSYLILENLLPMLYFLKKYEPKVNEKINEDIFESDAEGLLGKIIKSSMEENSESESQPPPGLLVSSVLTREPGKDPLERALTSENI